MKSALALPVVPLKNPLYNSQPLEPLFGYILAKHPEGHTTSITVDVCPPYPFICS